MILDANEGRPGQPQMMMKCTNYHMTAQDVTWSTRWKVVLCCSTTCGA